MADLGQRRTRNLLRFLLESKTGVVQLTDSDKHLSLLTMKVLEAAQLMSNRRRAPSSCDLTDSRACLY